MLSIDIEPGRVVAQVQGSRKRPYDVAITVDTISPEDWEKLKTVMAEQPIIAASLLSGRMPENIEETFTVAGLSMFPIRCQDLGTDCSCPDWSNPCKHIAAVYLLLGEEFDRDPFLIFRLQGMERDNLLGPEFRRSAQTLEAPILPAEPLPAGAGRFLDQPLANATRRRLRRSCHQTWHRCRPVAATGEIPAVAEQPAVRGRHEVHLRHRIRTRRFILRQRR